MFTFIVVLFVVQGSYFCLLIIYVLVSQAKFSNCTLLSFLLSLIHLSAIIYLLMTLNFSSHSGNLLSLNQSTTEYLLIGLPAQLSKISDPSFLVPSNVTITPAQSARNLGIIFDSTLSMSDHIYPPFLNLASYLFTIFEG